MAVVQASEGRARRARGTCLSVQAVNGAPEHIRRRRGTHGRRHGHTTRGHTSSRRTAHGAGHPVHGARRTGTQYTIHGAPEHQRTVHNSWHTEKTEHQRTAHGSRSTVPRAQDTDHRSWHTDATDNRYAPPETPQKREPM